MRVWLQFWSWLRWCWRFKEVLPFAVGRVDNRELTRSDLEFAASIDLDAQLAKLGIDKSELIV